LPKPFGHSGKSQTPKKILGNLGTFMMPDNFELIIRVQNSFCCYPPPLQVLSHNVREYVGQNKMRSSCELEGVF